MKKRIVLLFIFALVMSLILAGCGKNYTFDDISTMTSSNQKYTINSINGNTFALYGGQKTANVKDVGTVNYSSEKTTYEYSLEGNDIIIVDGIRYTYSIDAKENSVHFSPSFLDCAATFDFAVHFK